MLQKNHNPMSHVVGRVTNKRKCYGRIHLLKWQCEFDAGIFWCKGLEDVPALAAKLQFFLFFKNEIYVFFISPYTKCCVRMYEEYCKNP